MGTRGIFGFYKDGVDKITYNDHDSYLEELGCKIVKFIKNNTINEMNDIYNNIELIKENEENKYITKTLEDFKNGLKSMPDSKDFMKDSLYCEYGYIINLDTNKLEIYKGFQKKPQENRYYVDKPKYTTDDSVKFYNCTLLKEYDLNNIPDNWINEITEIESKAV